VVLFGFANGLVAGSFPLGMVLALFITGVTKTENLKRIYLGDVILPLPAIEFQKLILSALYSGRAIIGFLLFLGMKAVL